MKSNNSWLRLLGHLLKLHFVFVLSNLEKQIRFHNLGKTVCSHTRSMNPGHSISSLEVVDIGRPFVGCSQTLTSSSQFNLESFVLHLRWDLDIQMRNQELNDMGYTSK